MSLEFFWSRPKHKFIFKNFVFHIQEFFISYSRLFFSYTNLFFIYKTVTLECI